VDAEYYVRKVVDVFDDEKDADNRPLPSKASNLKSITVDDNDDSNTTNNYKHNN
jgi:hypothetical protein